MSTCFESPSSSFPGCFMMPYSPLTPYPPAFLELSVCSQQMRRLLVHMMYSNIETDASCARHCQARGSSTVTWGRSISSAASP